MGIWNLELWGEFINSVMTFEVKFLNLLRRFFEDLILNQTSHKILKHKTWTISQVCKKTRQNLQKSPENKIKQSFYDYLF